MLGCKTKALKGLSLCISKYFGVAYISLSLLPPSTWILLFFFIFRIPGEPGSAGLPGLAGKDGWRGQPGVSGQKVGHGPLYISNIIQ